MSQTTPTSTPLGELVVAAFDVAAQHSSDPREVSRLATRTVMDMLRFSRHARGRKREGLEGLDRGRRSHDTTGR